MEGKSYWCLVWNGGMRWFLIVTIHHSPIPYQAPIRILSIFVCVICNPNPPWEKIRPDCLSALVPAKDFVAAPKKIEKLLVHQRSSPENDVRFYLFRNYSSFFFFCGVSKFSLIVLLHSTFDVDVGHSWDLSQIENIEVAVKLVDRLILNRTLGNVLLLKHLPQRHINQI